MRKIVIIGPESTGKSTLCQHLADYYKTVWCPEFAREYLLQLGRAYTFDDLLKIAMGQLELEDTMATLASNYYFIDTDMHVMKVWCEVAFNQCHSWILKQIAVRQYDLYLLCDVDLPWAPDALREYPELAIRKKLFKMYQDLLVNGNTKWAIISGVHNERLQIAISIIDNIFGRR
ncbi:MAG: ATP-binding protein [Flavisolibacter sp.]|nr:ATP-binding protein [Flavisolibacter sp.]